MKINEIIKEKRKAQNLTQEQVAKYLGVSTISVSKWEEGTTYPDIAILPALARLLEVDLNTLLCFKNYISDQEVDMFTNRLLHEIEDNGFEVGFKMAMDKIREYPNCDWLIYSVALVLQGEMFLIKDPAHNIYAAEIEELYMRVANSSNEKIREAANSTLINKYIKEKEYDMAQDLIEALPKVKIDRDQKQAQLYISKGELTKAWSILERKLIKMATELQMTLMTMMDVALQENKRSEANYFADVAAKTAEACDLWDYNVYIAHFQLAVARKDIDKCIQILEVILKSDKSRWDLSKSPLYQHVNKQKDELDLNEILLMLVTEIQHGKEYEFMRSDPRFEQLVINFLDTKKVMAR